MLFVNIILISLLVWKFHLKRDSNFLLSGLLINKNILTTFLLIWIVYGFFTRLDYSEAHGCLIEEEFIWDTKNIIFSSISIISIITIYFSKNKTYLKYLVSFELIYWISKLFIFKWGYAVGFTGTPNDNIVLFDLISLILRLLLLFQIIELRKINLYKTGITIIGIILIKTLILTTPLSMYYYQMQNLKEAKKIRSEIIGYWQGSITSINKKSETIEINIDKDSIYFYKTDLLDSVYYFNLEYSIMGDIHNTNDYRSFFITKYTSDSLILDIGNRNESLQISLSKK